MMKLRTPELYQKALAEGRIRNKLAAARSGGGSWPTVHRFTSAGGTQAQLVNLEALGRFLVHGLGISPEELSRMPIGELFEISQEPQEPKA